VFLDEKLRTKNRNTSAPKTLKMDKPQSNRRIIPCFSWKKTGKTLTSLLNKSCFFVSVFHRILDFKAGLDFYHGPFFILSSKLHHECVFH
jgi:hypothetical protein